jgi:hypothetical protein
VIDRDLDALTLDQTQTFLAAVDEGGLLPLIFGDIAVFKKEGFRDTACPRLRRRLTLVCDFGPASLLRPEGHRSRPNWTGVVGAFRGPRFAASGLCTKEDRSARGRRGTPTPIGYGFRSASLRPAQEGS